MGADVLSPNEKAALALSGRLAGMVRRVIGDGPQSGNDWAEAAGHLHAVQHMILAQAAARAYPYEYRLLGELIPEPDRPEPAGRIVAPAPDDGG